ncbi:ATP-binding protein [Trinickia soli]|uniref:ATP-binding protein n=1 Tax=Trinickia soli TaxID=380675 RepID=UPI003FA3D46B
MATDSLRPLPIDQHPVVLCKYRIPTPSIAEFYALLLRCLTLRTGATVYARSRVGKTYATLFLESLLASQRPTLPILRMRCQHKRIPTETAFFSTLLTMARHKASSRRDPTQLRQRFTQRLLEIADQAHSNVILVFLDEAQHLTYSEFEWLRDIHDELEIEGVCVVTMFVGQPSLRSKKSIFQRDGEEQIVARFMTEELPFHGVRSAQECSACLQGYDQANILRTPAGTTPGFSFPARTRPACAWTGKATRCGKPSTTLTSVRNWWGSWRFPWNSSRAQSSTSCASTRSMTARTLPFPKRSGTKASTSPAMRAPESNGLQSGACQLPWQRNQAGVGLPPPTYTTRPAWTCKLESAWSRISKFQMLNCLNWQQLGEALASLSATTANAGIDLRAADAFDIGALAGTLCIEPHELEGAFCIASRHETALSIQN